VADERRRHVRKAVELPVTYQLDGSEPESARARDLSLGGAFIVTFNEPPFGTKIRLTMPLSAMTIEVEATVRWHRKGEGFGVQFALLGAKATYHLTEFVADMDPIPDSRMLQPDDL